MDTDLKSIISPFLLKAHPIVREFIISGDLVDTIEQISYPYNLNDSEISDISDIVTLILIGISNPDELPIKVSGITGLPQSTSDDLSMSIQDIILSTISMKIESLNNVSGQKSSNVGDDFERMVMNQARAMRPAVEAPSNLPGEELQIESSEPRVIHNYKGEDPYRETPA